MAKKHRLIWQVAASSVLAVHAQSAIAASPEDVAAADALFEQARALISAGNFAEACPKFEESQRLDPASGTLINLAECYEKQGRSASALSKYLDAAAAAQASGNAARASVATERAAALRPSVPRVTVLVTAPDTAGLEVRRDGVVLDRSQWNLELPVDPGEHALLASAPGKKSWQTTIVLQPGAGVTSVTIPDLVAENAGALPPSALPKPNAATAASGGLGTQRTLAIASAGVGVVGVVLGTVFGLRSKAKHDESFEICPTNPCDDSAGQQAMAAAQTAGNVATVSFVVAGAALAGAGILWFTATPPKSSGNARIGLSLGRIDLHGSF